MMERLALLVVGTVLPGLIQTPRLGLATPRPHLPRPLSSPHGRRSFMRWAIVGGLAVTTAQVSLVVIRFFWPNRTDAFGSDILAATRATLPTVGGAPLRNVAGRFYLIRNQDGLLAFYWQCTHLGCTVPWIEAEGQFHCPCHGSIFDRHGLVIGGPAPRPLDCMEITLQGENVVVNTGKISQRSGFSPGQVTKI